MGDSNASSAAVDEPLLPLLTDFFELNFFDEADFFDFLDERCGAASQGKAENKSEQSELPSAPRCNQRTH